MGQSSETSGTNAGIASPKSQVTREGKIRSHVADWIAGKRDEGAAEGSVDISDDQRLGKV